jgi:hypothetical protein
MTDWHDVLSWWGTVAREISTNEFEVNLTDFSLRKKWLRSYWVDLDRKIEIDPKISIALNSLENTMESFDKSSRSFEGSKNLLTKEVLESRYKRKLTDFQVKNINNLFEMKSGANFSVPGSMAPRKEPTRTS